MKKRIIITGGTGQDGVILSKLLLKKKYVIFSLINKKKFYKIKKVNYIKINLRNQKIVLKVIKKIKPHAIIHLAARNYSRANNYKVKDKHSYNENLKSAKNLIDSTIKINKKIKFIFAGSSLMFKKKGGIVDERSKLGPSCYYSKYKIEIHKYLIKMKNTFNLFATTAIFFNHDSKYRNSKFLLPRLAKLIKKNQIKEIYKIYQHNIYGDFSHAEDICRGIISLLNLKKSPDKIILSSNKLSRINKLIEYGLAKKKISFNFALPNKKIVNLIGDNALARKVLKWKPKLNHLIAFKEIFEK